MATLVDSEPEYKPQRVGLKYCRSCWRKDVHESVWRLPPWARRTLKIVTLGWIHRVEPSRCVCCGTLRVF